MADGVVARKTNTVCELGSKLDTVADFVFILVCMIKLLPILNIPLWLWIWIEIIGVIKIVCKCCFRICGSQEICGSAYSNE